MEYKVIVYDKNDFPVEYLLDKTLNKIGRSSKNDIILTDKNFTVSRFHCEIEISKDKIVLRDLSSKNGTFVNGKRITKSVLSYGDEIDIGSFKMKFLGKRKDESIVKDDASYTVIKNVDSLENYWEKPQAEKDILKPLINLAKKLIENWNIESLLNITANFILKYINPDRVFIFFKEEDELDLKFKKQKVEKIEKDSYISKTILDKVVSDNVSILSLDTEKDKRFSNAESIINLGIRSVVAVPMFYKKSIYGVIYLDRLVNRKFFNERDLEFTTIISNYISLAVKQLNLLEKLNKEKKVRERLEKYHSPPVVDKIMKIGDKENIFAFTKGVATIMFLDIVDFTSISEKYMPEEVGDLLNKFFGEVTEVIFKYKGTLDKYIGDGLMAVFGMPLKIKNHEEKSIKTALDIVKGLNKFNKENNKILDLQIRIGIDSGEVISGNFGSFRRMEYSVLGDPVNLASRFEEQVAKPNEIIVGEKLYKKTSELFDFKYLGEKDIRGVSKKIKIYKVLGERNEKN